MTLRSPERAAALAAGELTYFTGTTCPNGHVAARYVKSTACLECARLYNKRWSDKNPGANTARRNRHRKERPDLAKETAKRFRQRHPEKVAATFQAWREKNKDYVRDYMRAWLDANPEKHLANGRKWRAKNRDKAIEAVRQWALRNPERAREVSAARDNNRRVRETSNGGRFTADDVAQLKKQQRNRCAACSTKLTRYEVDHVRPVARGGSSEPHNLQLLCPPCNRSKGAKDPIEWAQSKGRLL